MSQPQSGSSDASPVTPQIDVTDAAPIDVTDAAIEAADDAIEVIEDADVEVVESEEPTSFSDKHPFVIYSALRFGLLVVAGGICYLLGARGILLILLAFFISAIASFVFLIPQRERVGQRTGSYFRRLNDKIEASKVAEDDLVEQSAGDDTDGQQQPKN